MSVKILLVDDEQKIVQLIQETSALLQWCEVVPLTDSRQAQPLLQKEKFDGVILDAVMPEPDGFELTRAIRGSPRNAALPVVMLTEDEDIETMRKGFKAGVTFFMIKPSNRERVYALFNAVRGTMVRERRRHARLPYRTKVTCHLGQNLERHFVAESTDLGEGGMSLRLLGGLDVGQELVLSFRLPEPLKVARPEVVKPKRSMFAEDSAESAESKNLRAVVRYQKSPDLVGLEFLSLPSAYRQSIQDYISGAEED